MWFDRFNLLMSILLALAAILQYNDPDPLQWVALYGLAAALSLLYAAHRLPVWLAGVVSLGALGAGLVLLVERAGRYGLFLTEEGNEVLGLAIVALWSGILAMRTHRRRSTSPVAHEDAP